MARISNYATFFKTQSFYIFLLPRNIIPTISPMRFYVVLSVLACAVAAAPLPAQHTPYDGTLGGLLKTLAPITGAVGDVVNKLTNDLGQGSH
ncbi:hypothetical protein BX070DRAFT_224110 [Coemansia spiralis]|uniref:Uncharacterized protein n=1 Tax=Coemansia umbellata TaxID=1424467 RepID=A0ABQ8PM58_9FUNG|nr:hypothetical protein BX070DRAFT_224110 [Coemansia spiralis]KAJ1991999.1 hypothetical protein EDC05_003154 [Coemansia umbellata]